MTPAFAVVEAGEARGGAQDEIVVPWWSFTKTLIAAATLALVRDARLKLDDNLPGRAFTLRQVLGHRAGLTDYGGLSDYHAAVAADLEPWPVDELLRRADANKLLYPPGQGWHYSNIGYLLLRQMIEHTTGADLQTALIRLVIDPLGVSGPRIASSRSDLADVTMGAITSYHPGWVYHDLAVGTVRDAALLLDRLLSGHLLPPDLLAAMMDAHSLEMQTGMDRPWRTTGYGLGLMIGTRADGVAVQGHTGGGPGSSFAAYRCLTASGPVTAAAFAAGDVPGEVEQRVFFAQD